jgi:copper(I)-binding protein
MKVNRQFAQIRAARLWPLLAALAAACAAPSLALVDQFGLPGSIGGVCAAYFTIDNATDQADVLIGARSDVADIVELHAIKSGADGMITMEPQAEVDVPAHSRVEFKPGGLHVMFTNLKRDLKPGDVFQLTLQFRHTGEVTLQVMVKDL